MKRTYWTNPDIFEAEVDVKAVGDCRVTITPIIFHPAEGGQPADKGAIGESNVCNVEVIEGQIIHTLDTPLTDGKHIARLDRQHRFYTASQHTAQHIMSGIAERQFGLATTGVHIGPESCTVDFDKAVDWETAKELELRSMEAVVANIPVETVFNDEDVRIRSDSKEIESDVIRVVKIGDYDKSACCGAHVRATGQIGVIRIFDIESKKKGTRISFLAGQKALTRSQLETSILRRLRKSASCSTSELPAIFEKALDHTKELTKEVNRLWSMTLPVLAESAEVTEVESTRIGIQVADVPSKLVAKLAGMIADTVDGVGIAVSGFNIAISSNGMSASDLFQRIRKSIGGKGGGSAKAANGRLSRPVTADELTAIFNIR
ncbi:MAG: alanyl-tRNA editing protein [Phycisphaerales bacterium]|nr:MAG: alanyl-tRNA editing protein [Phycisphaerales bacterium]